MMMSGTIHGVALGGKGGFLGLLQQKQQAASGTYFADKGQGLAHDVGDGDGGDASSMPAHKKPKVGPTTAVTTTEAQEEAEDKQPKAQPKSEAQPNPLPKSSEEQQPKRKSCCELLVEPGRQRRGPGNSTSGLICRCGAILLLLFIFLPAAAHIHRTAESGL